MYWAVDIHGTVLKPTYSDKGIATDFYPYAEQVLKMLSDNPDNVLIMFTSSKPSTIDNYGYFFTDRGIKFKYANSNPEIQNVGHGWFTNKFYFNVMIEDKAGFDPDVDWKDILDYHEREVNG